MNICLAERKILKSYISAHATTFPLLASLALTLIWGPPRTVTLGKPCGCHWQAWDVSSSKGQLMVTTRHRWLPALGMMLMAARHMSGEQPCRLHYSSEPWTDSDIKSSASNSQERSVIIHLFRPLHYHTAMI